MQTRVIIQTESLLLHMNGPLGYIYIEQMRKPKFFCKHYRHSGSKYIEFSDNIDFAFAFAWHEQALKL